MTPIVLREQLQSTLHGFQQGSLKDNALALLGQLGYRSDKQIDLEPNTVATFKETFEVPEHVTFNDEKALVDQWQSVDFLMQLAGDDLAIGGQLPLVRSNAVDTSAEAWQSYLFFAIHLRDREKPYTRTDLANITREVNKLFLMPAMLIFQHGQTITLSVINRRLNKRYPERDVLEKVTLIKDINVAQTHRAHLEILADLSSDELYQVHGFNTFEELHRAWQKTLDSSELNKRFFQEVANWYFWAVQHVKFPDNGQMEEQNRNEVNLIRLITRLIFVWFLKEKGLVSDDLFNPRRLKQWLQTLSKDESSYYRAILQNLFFATLNQEMGKRGFRNKAKAGRRDQNYMVTNLYRYEDYFKDSAPVMALFESIPFLNGGLFECLDRRAEQDDGSSIDIRIDGFSDNPRFSAVVPNELFFADEHDPDVDLNEVYGGRNRRYKVRGILEIFNSYKFTVTENTPIEEEIALDPELLGKVFENLLAAYNPETQTTARKQTGSFYTPREIVNYMVDESLVTYLKTQLTPEDTDQAEAEALETKLRQLVDFTSTGNPFKDDPATTLQVIVAINSLKVLDPAVGSGAFPMGMLQKLVLLLGKLDPENALWKHEQKERAIRPVLADIQQAQQISYDQAREAAMAELKGRLAEIEDDFANNAMDYPRKLFLIENCIYGVDIQPVAVQIAKLRFFISLVVEQTPDDSKENRGIKALPNLETQFVTANTLFAIQDQMSLRSPEVIEKEEELKKIRRSIFSAKTQRTKHKYREQDKQLRKEISVLLRATGLEAATADTLANWDPYDQNSSASFFDPHWMFGLNEGFDIVIANPPYVRQEQIREIKPLLKPQYTCYTGVADLYVYFFERGIQLLKDSGILTYISSNKYFRANYGEKLRDLLSQKTHVHTLIDFGDAPIFTAIAYPSIVITQNEAPNGNVITALNWETERPVEEFLEEFKAEKFDLKQTYLTKQGWQLESPRVFKLLKKLRAAGTPLGKYVNGRFYYGIKTGYNQAFVVDRATRNALIAAHSSSAEVLKPFVRGRDVKRWSIDKPENWLLFIPWHFPLHKDSSIKGSSPKAEKAFKKQYPAIYEHLFQFKKKLSSRNKAETGIRYEWYALQRCAATYWEEFDHPKITYPDIFESRSFALDTRKLYTANTCYFIPTDETWLCGLLNTAIFEWFYSNISNSVRGGYLRAFSDYMKQIPIPPASDADKAAISALVQKCLDAKGQGVAQWEAEIDDRVAHLYGLTAEDMQIIRGE